MNCKCIENNDISHIPQPTHHRCVQNGTIITISKVGKLGALHVKTIISQRTEFVIEVNTGYSLSHSKCMPQEWHFNEKEQNSAGLPARELKQNLRSIVRPITVFLRYH